jgi:hypothetical protein
MLLHGDVTPNGGTLEGVDPTVVSPAAISITAAPAERSCQGRTAHTGSRASLFGAGGMIFKQVPSVEARRQPCIPL